MKGLQGEVYQMLKILHTGTGDRAFRILCLQAKLLQFDQEASSAGDTRMSEGKLTRQGGTHMILAEQLHSRSWRNWDDQEKSKAGS